MRKALIVGIDHYEHINGLCGCVNDAYSVKTMLDRHSDGSRNFDVRILVGTGPGAPVNRATLRDAVRQLFSDDPEIALFYFAGHGHIEVAGGFLAASDTHPGDDGLPIQDVLTYAHLSKARNKVLILDSCHSGIAGNPDPVAPNRAELTEGMTILTAAGAKQYASEENGSGVFTSLLVDALGGAAATLVGDVTPGGIYAHIDQALGWWEQRPVFKTNVKSFVSLRKAQPPIPIEELRRLADFFPVPGAEFSLNPSFEPERGPGQDDLPPPNPTNTAQFAVLQRYNRVNLVVPVDAPHMWHAAINSKSCKLTVLGEHYRRLVAKGRI